MKTKRGTRKSLHNEAYNEGVFYAETDWQWLMSIGDEPTEQEAEMMGDRPPNLAAHRALSWTFMSQVVCPQWSNAHARRSFYLGYEDRATELADAGEAGYEALAEAGSVADTGFWIVQSERWTEKASSNEKARRAQRAVWAGAAQWQALAAGTGTKDDRRRAEGALTRAKNAGTRTLIRGATEAR